MHGGNEISLNLASREGIFLRSSTSVSKFRHLSTNISISVNPIQTAGTK